MALFIACTSMISYAQSQTVKGKVLDNEGLEVLGGSVMIKGVPGGGTVTDLQGNYASTSKNKCHQKDFCSAHNKKTLVSNSVYATKLLVHHFKQF